MYVQDVFIYIIILTDGQQQTSDRRTDKQTNERQTDDETNKQTSKQVTNRRTNKRKQTNMLTIGRDCRPYIGVCNYCWYRYWYRWYQ